ncbi:MAG: zonular occludens toxin domain-containing protein [Alcaligenaceae bacterium]
MSIKAYVGRQGAGKTYEVVSHVILNGLRRGRRVVSNIAGLNFDAMRGLLLSEGVPFDQIGELVSVSHDQVLEPHFFRTDEDVKRGLESFIQPGDLVALDEIWRFWKARGDIPSRHMNFFRMHRHFAHEKTGLTCDVAIITQQVRDINLSIRGVIEETYRMTKATAIGSSKRYRVDIFQGGSDKRSDQLRQIFKVYDLKYFGLYSSHSQKSEGGADAQEENIDQRGNVLKGALFRIVLPVGLVLLFVPIFLIYRFLNPKDESKVVPVSSQSVSQSAVNKPVSSVSDDWRVAGYWTEGAGVYVLLSDGKKTRVLTNPPRLKLTGMSVESYLPTGEAVTSWSGKARPDVADRLVGGKP